MAKFIPSLEEIKCNPMEQPTAGELYLLEQLESLDDNYEIYFQTHINVSHPDIVILKKGCGAIIIEVKDWNLNAYEFYPNFNHRKFGVLVEKGGYHEICNPFEQVHSYKEELYQMYSPALYIGKIKDTKTYGVVKTGVFFYNAKEAEVEEKFKKQNFKNKKFLKYYSYWAKDSENLINDICYMLNPNSLFSDEIYEQIQSILTPSFEWREQSQFFVLGKEQDKYAISQAGKRQKIKGVAGSGKTLVLAQRAVNCYQRIHEPILILTFNITLPHYIKDKISQITRSLSSYDKKQFHILPIYDFVKQMMQIYGIRCPEADLEVSTEELLNHRLGLLKKVSGRIRKYKAILIDEVQDFRCDWLEQIEDLFLAKDGEFVLFGDEKQNIYNRSMDEKKLPKTRIKGDWIQLKTCYRVTQANGQLAQEFQKQYFQGKYEQTQVDYFQPTLGDCNVREEMRYYNISDSIQSPERIFNIIEQFRKEGTPIALNDICVLSSNHGILRELDYYCRTQRHILSKNICETKEEYNELMQAEKEGKILRADIEKNLYELRRIKKFSFYMNPGVMKFSTIHSFKGWEINTVVLILDNQSNTSLEDELIYTAITRAKRNLVIINLGNERYHDFFQNNIKNI